jgi:proteasome lid subunit RPN8/RPN11
MKLEISEEIIARIHRDGESAYPEEGAGLLLGHENGDSRTVVDILQLKNSREDSARHNRYMITGQDMFEGEKEAMRRKMDVVGVFHSHPDHPNRPSEFDREWALPWYSYIITSIKQGQADGSRSWRLTDDRESFIEEKIAIQQEIIKT